MKLCLFGDFNCRICEYQKLDYNITQNIPNINENRTSREKINSQARKFIELLEELNVWLGDVSGESFSGVIGSIEIDYAVFSQSCPQYVTEFKKLNYPHSDQMSISWNLKLQQKESEQSS